MDERLPVFKRIDHQPPLDGGKSVCFLCREYREGVICYYSAYAGVWLCNNDRRPCKSRFAHLGGRYSAEVAAAIISEIEVNDEA